MLGLEEIVKNLKLKTKNSDGIFVYLPEISDFKKQEIFFHDEINNEEEEIHQLDSLRNHYYHQYFKKWLYQLPSNSTILEIGAAAGYDLIPILKKGYNVVACDISLASIKALKAKIENSYPQFKDQVAYLVADGQNLPFGQESFAAVFLVATLHHFENQNNLLAQIKKITKKGGLIILAMEPSRLMMRFTKLFKNAKSLRLFNSSSAADETHAGYCLRDWSQIVNRESRYANGDLRIAKIKRVWLLQGFIHYGLEAIFRLFKLKKRLKLPRFLEWFFLILDEILLKIPLLNRLNWHWVIIIQN